MLDINLFREEKGGDPEAIRRSVKARYKDPAIVDEVIALDKEWRKAQFVAENIKADQGKIQKDMGAMKKADKNADISELQAQSAAKVAEYEKAIQVADELRGKVMALVKTIGNIVHESVPVSATEDDNAIAKTWGEPQKPTKFHHHQLLWMIGGCLHPLQAAEISGHRAYFLTGPGVLLNQALIAYANQFLLKRSYTLVQTPFFMKRNVMSETAQLSDFNEQLYKVVEKEDTAPEDELYLIATSEQPISAMHRGERIEPQQLPIRYAGNSTCFRKEAGGHGRDVWGIFRVHQFEKVEQFCVTTPEDDASWKMHEEMIATSEEFYQSLELPYRVVTIVSKELNDAAAKKYDLEAWFPTLGVYRELVSCSNCTDYQSRRLNIRYAGSKKKGQEEKQFVHMLNSTLCATERTICCILENYQTDDYTDKDGKKVAGVRVPKALQPFCGTDFFPFVKSEKDIVVNDKKSLEKAAQQEEKKEQTSSSS